jgi:hypothetical protein
MEATGRLITNPSIDAPPDWEPHNKGVTPVFFVESVHFFEADGKTFRLGPDGKPMTKEQEFVRIVIAGDSLAEACSPVDEAIRQRFAEQYSKWKANMDAIPDHPLEDCPYLTTKLIHELYANNINSEDDLAALSDGNVHCIRNCRALREKARARTQAREDSAVTDKLAEAIATLQARLDAKDQELAKLRAPQKKPKRPAVSVGTRQKMREAMLARIAAKKAAEQASP